MRRGSPARPAEETVDDRLAVFLEGRARRRRIAQDDLAALTESRTGRLHLIRLARTSDPEAARQFQGSDRPRKTAARQSRAAVSHRLNRATPDRAAPQAAVRFWFAKSQLIRCSKNAPI